MSQTSGLHHITAIAADPQKNVDFYEGFLGQRFVKKTVNFDDPSAYHLYYGDYVGSPGTAMTFFSWQGMPSGTPGVGEVDAIYYRIPAGSEEYWQKRAVDFGVSCESAKLAGESALSMRDPDGHKLFLVTSRLEEVPVLRQWTDGVVPLENLLMGFYGVRMVVADEAMVSPILIEVFGYEKVYEDDFLRRYQVPGSLGTMIDVSVKPDAPPARQGVGSVHHIAFRAKDDDEREEFRERLINLGLSPTGLVDRTFFNATYCWTPARILFEISTDQPGFTVNEPEATLGESLVLPEQYEHLRVPIEKNLPPIRLPRHG